MKIKELDSIKEKYPEIAKMTQFDVIMSDEFTGFIDSTAYGFPRLINPYLLKSLAKDGLLEPEKFKAEYVACLDKVSNLPYAKRVAIMALGSAVYAKTIKKMMIDYDNRECT